MNRAAVSVLVGALIAWPSGCSAEDAAAPAALATPAGSAADTAGVPAETTRSAANAGARASAGPDEVAPERADATLTDTVAGVVIGLDGSPMAGARVRLFRRLRHWPRRDREEIGFVRSGTGGQFVFAVSRERNLEIEVEATGCATQTRPVPPSDRSAALAVRLEPGFQVRGRVVLPAGRAAEGCAVFLEPGPGSFMRAMATRTGREGRFTFAGVPADSLRLTARHDSYQPVTTNHIAVGRGATLKFEDSALGLSGRIVSGDKPLSGCTILVYPRTSNGMLFVPFQDTTNASGEFTVRGLGQGLYNVEIRHPNHSSTQRSLSMNRSRTGLALELQPRVRVRGRLVGVKELEPVQLALVSFYGEIDVADVRPDGSFEFAAGFSRGMATLELLDGVYSFQVSQSRWLRRALMDDGGDLELPIEAATVVAGRVLGSAGDPLEGVEVLVALKVLEDPWNLLTDPGLFAARRRVLATTDGDGRYAIRGLEPGEVSLVFQKEQFAHLQHVGRVALEPSPAESVVELAPPGTIRGRVTRGGRPVAGALVSVGQATARAFTGPDGRYALRGLPAGEHIVRVKYRTLPIAHAAEALALRAGQTVSGVDVALPLGRRLTGRVVDPEEMPMPGVFVESQAGTTTRTDEAGRFELDVPAGSTTLHVRAAEFDPVADRIPVAAGAADVLVRLRNAQRAGIEAQVLALPKETPVVGLVLRLDAEENAQFTAASNPVHFLHLLSRLQRLNEHHVRGQVERWVEIPDGELQIQNLPAGTYTLTLHARGLQPFVKTVVLVNGRTLGLGVVKLEPGFRVHGVVVDPGGKPVSGARVVLGRESDLTLAGARTRYITDRKGRFAVDGVGLRQRDIYVAAKGFATQRHELDLEKDIMRPATDPVRVQMRAGATIKVLLVDAEGDPVPFKKVQLNRGFQRIGEAETDDQGLAWFHHVSTGSYHVYLLGRLRSLRNQVVGDTQGRKVYEVKVLDVPARRDRRSQRRR